MHGFVSAAVVKAGVPDGRRRVSLTDRAAQQGRGSTPQSLARIIASTAPNASAFQSAL
ncbi:hypothetical protein ABT071_34780 [Streptomyces sp. NPDC002506]|uniref:hypothetical protein n=1 Tax=Streptomyces sp. NPDC002506 TaxID=3154536 RepID=UPI0033230732